MAVFYVETKDGLVEIGGGLSVHNLLNGVLHPDTVLSTLVKGGIIVVNEDGKWSQLPIGTSAQVLTVNGGTAAWGAAPGSVHALLDALNHTDTTSQGVQEGSMIIGNSTPKKWSTTAMMIIAAAKMATFLRRVINLPNALDVRRISSSFDARFTNTSCRSLHASEQNFPVGPRISQVPQNGLPHCLQRPTASMDG